MEISRRAWLGFASGATLAAALPVALLRRKRGTPVGLVHDPTGLFDTLPGFEVRVLDRTGDRMADGHVVPGSPDGMAAFGGETGRLILLRNHELARSDRALSAHPDGDAPELAYDRASHGAVSRLVVDAETLRVVSSNLVLTGTTKNCAGGTSPWGFLSCEEDVTDDHGFVFICDPRDSVLAKPRRVDPYGRFRHEAATVDATTMIAYLTEDREDSAFYRFVPKHASAPFEGKLMALALDGEHVDTGPMLPGDQRRIRWVDAGDPTPANDDLRARAHASGAAIVRRGEGLFLTRQSGRLEVFFTATSGGPVSAGQLFRLLPDGEGGTLEVVCASTDRETLDMPDNLIVAPSGHILMAEDGVGPNGIKVLCPSGRLLTIGVDPSGGEIAGLSLAPPGDVLFANLQSRGITIAIRGPIADLG